MEPFRDVTLAVGQAEGRSLTALLDELFGGQERLVGPNKYMCSSCCHLCEATRTARLADTPAVLTLHMNRSPATGGGSKLRTPIAVPLTLATAHWDEGGGPTSATPPRATHRLRAAVFHSGHTASSGHYVCAALTPKGWVHFDDEVARWSSEAEFSALLSSRALSASTGFLLFYERGF